MFPPQVRLKLTEHRIGTYLVKENVQTPCPAPNNGMDREVQLQGN